MFNCLAILISKFLNKTHTEYYASQVDFETKRIKRLEEYINDAEPQVKAKSK
jgi:hypothetical protein